MAKYDLNNRVALVLGAGSVGPGWGNGKAAACAYASSGAALVCVDLELERAQQTVDTIKEDLPQTKCLAMQGNVTNGNELAGIVSVIIEQFGRIDILHYNVGAGEFGGVLDTTEQEWDAIFAINMKGAFLACQQVIPYMEKQGGGVITLISSIASIGIGSYPYIAYQASKAALNHFTHAIAVNHAGKGIRANVILPGLMDTPVIYAHKLMVDLYGGVEQMIEKRHAASPTGKMGTAWDIAHAAVFLASDEANYINGIILPVDGGLSCRMA